MTVGFRLRSCMMVKDSDGSALGLEARILLDGEAQETVFCHFKFPVLPVTQQEAEAVREAFDVFLVKVVEQTCSLSPELH